MFWRHFSRVVGLLARSPVLPSSCCVLVGKEKCPDVFYRIYFMITMAVCVCFLAVYSVAFR
jgi:hypothetical protein